MAARKNGKTAFHRFVDICHQFFHGFTLGGASRNRRHLRPKTAFFRLVNTHFKLHSFRRPWNSLLRRFIFSKESVNRLWHLLFNHPLNIFLALCPNCKAFPIFSCFCYFC